MSEVILKIIEKVLYRYAINVNKHPEYLSRDGKVCERNAKVANAVLAVMELRKGLKPCQK